MNAPDVVYHYVIATLGWQPAWSTWVEGVELFARVAGALGDSLHALCVMPDHVHAIASEDRRRALGAASSGYARWRHHRRGGRGPLFRPIEVPLPRRGLKKILRDQRYVELNPCRAGLVSDPLAYPLSTWRDRMGLAWPLVRPKANDPARWHAYATSDDYVEARGLPGQIGAREPADVEAAVSALCRCPPSALRRRGAPRTLFVCGLRALTPLTTAQVAARADLSIRRVHSMRDHPALPILERVAGDPRFGLLHAADLTREPAWQRYLRRSRTPPRLDAWI